MGTRDKDMEDAEDTVGGIVVVVSCDDDSDDDNDSLVLLLLIVVDATSNSEWSHGRNSKLDQGSCDSIEQKQQQQPSWCRSSLSFQEKLVASFQMMMHEVDEVSWCIQVQKEEGAVVIVGSRMRRSVVTIPKTKPIHM
jgi:hypothetical protein